MSAHRETEEQEKRPETEEEGDSELRYLLKDEERGEGPGDVQLNEVQAGLPVGQRRPLWQRETHAHTKLRSRDESAGQLSATRGSTRASHRSRCR